MITEDEKILAGSDTVKQVRSWGRWSLGWGVINLIFSGLSNPFGLLLLVIGVASFYFGSASMFIVYGVVFLYAALSNLLVGDVIAYFFSIVLTISAVQAFRSYSRYRPVEMMIISSDEQTETAESHRTGVIRSRRIFPWSALLFALASLLGFFISIFMSIIWFLVTGSEETPDLFLFFGAVSIQFGVLAFSLGLASVLSGYRYKALSIISMLGGAAAMTIEYFLIATG